jgi:hypothetical protein
VGFGVRFCSVIIYFFVLLLVWFYFIWFFLGVVWGVLLRFVTGGLVEVSLWFFCFNGNVSGLFIVLFFLAFLECFVVMVLFFWLVDAGRGFLAGVW